MSALVSVIIPSYNSKEYICDAIDSALAQTHRDVEVIVVDDGSVDATGDMLKNKYGERIKYIFKANGGPASARNVGINNSRGEFIAFLDADDLWLPNKLAEQLLVFKPGVVLVGCSYQTKNDGSLAVMTFDGLVVSNAFSNSGVVVRRTAIEQVGLLDERPEFRAVEDWELILRLAVVGELLLLQRDLIVLRVMPGSISAPAQAEKMIRNETAVLKKHLIDRPLLYCRALSQRHFSVAWAFSTQGRKGLALRYIISCFFYYPPALVQKNKLGLCVKIVKDIVARKAS